MHKMHRRARAFEPEPEPERNIPMSKDLGNRIAEMLSKRRITQKELASTIGVTEAVISRYVSGETWLLYQALTGYELFTGEKPDPIKMAEVISGSR